MKKIKEDKKMNDKQLSGHDHLDFEIPKLSEETKAWNGKSTRRLKDAIDRFSDIVDEIDNDHQHNKQEDEE